MTVRKMQPYEMEAYLSDVEVSVTQRSYLLNQGKELDDEDFVRLVADCAEAYSRGETQVPGVQGVPQRPPFAHAKVPAAFLHLHTVTANDGRTFEKAFVRLPSGTNVNGVDVGGFSCDVFVSDYMKQQMLSGSPVTLSFKADEPVVIWMGRRGDEQRPYKRFEVNPWALVKGIKAENEAFRAARAAERGGKGASGHSLSGEARGAREASSALAGDDEHPAAVPQRSA